MSMIKRPFHVRAVVLPDDVERDLYVAGGQYVDAAPDRAVTLHTGGYVLPGLVDLHNHLSLQSPAGDSAPPERRVRASGQLEVSCGVLALREPGSPDRASAGLGPADGCPRVITAGRFLAPPDGYFPGLAREVSADALPDAVEDEARASGAWVKLIGDFLGPDGRLRANWPPEVLTEATHRAHALGCRVAIHVMTEAVIAAAIEAGVDSLEHGTGMLPDHVHAMAARGIAWVPTLTAGGSAEAVAFAQAMGMPSDTQDWLHRAYDRTPTMIALAAATGVRIFAGSDAGQFPHGTLVQQIHLLRAAGIPAEQALAAASWDARAYLGLPGGEPGAPADFVVYHDDPRTHYETLNHPTLIILDGRVIPVRPPVVTQAP
jgi:imidazolonepropionase-like amidohydrolase